MQATSQHYPPRQKASSTTPLPPFPFTIIRGTYCKLVPLDKSLHAQPLFDCLSDPSFWTYVYQFQQSGHSPQSPSELMALFSIYPFQFYVIQKLSQTTNHCLGCICLFTFPEKQSCEAAYVMYSKELQKTTMGTEVIYLLLKYAFEELGYNRCLWECHTLNEPSRVAALRYGFKFEGTMRANMIHRGCYRSTDFFSILKKEWAPLKEEYERWLKEDNFGENGEQKSKLRNKEIRIEMDKQEEQKERLWRQKNKT